MTEGFSIPDLGLEYWDSVPRQQLQGADGQTGTRFTWFTMSRASDLR